MIRVLNVVNIYFSVPYFFGDQFKYLQKNGFKIYLICSPSEHLEKYSNEQNIECYQIPITRRITPFTDLVSLIKICVYIKKNKIDIISGHTAKGGLLAVLAGRIMGVKKIIFFRHGVPFDRKEGISKKIFTILNRFMAKCATDIVCVSPSLAKLSIDYNLNKESKQIVLGSGTCGGIDTQNKFNPDLIDSSSQFNLKQKLGLDDNCLVVGYVGRLVNDKGIPELVESFKLLLLRHKAKKIKLLLVGPLELDKKERDSLNQLTRNEIMSNQDIIYTGYIKDDIQLYYSIMDIVVLPSYHEGFGMCVIEASSMTKPVLVSKSTGCVDAIIEGETGHYIDINPNSICAGLEVLLDDNYRKVLGQQGRKMVIQKFDHSVIWPQIINLYKK